MSSVAPDFLVHDNYDAVGVVVVEGITAGQSLEGWVMDSDQTLTMAVNEAIPLGHKFALKDLKDGDPVIKYGENIGRAVADIPKGYHVHVHNLKTSKW
ncbi:MAG: UxaA family hydrolase [Arenicellales bacterium]|nr:UxaA family hydrolase [Arenicellales bacterium]MDP6291334.1 UxaA family hydrolase [Arenicellales bacterium]MDP7523547.1 UxaA family hydrolase [Arenicellales bacterium]HJL56025.1 UxaA family hydrolase [Arenicellales bacterium]